VKSSDNLGNLNMEIEADMNGTKMPMESKIDMVYKTTNEAAPKNNSIKIVKEIASNFRGDFYFTNSSKSLSKVLSKSLDFPG
jgi:hypothetical protein